MRLALASLLLCGPLAFAQQQGIAYSDFPLLMLRHEIEGDYSDERLVRLGTAARVAKEQLEESSQCGLPESWEDRVNRCANSLPLEDCLSLLQPMQNEAKNKKLEKVLHGLAYINNEAHRAAKLEKRSQRAFAFRKLLQFFYSIVSMPHKAEGTQHPLELLRNLNTQIPFKPALDEGETYNSKTALHEAEFLVDTRQPERILQAENYEGLSPIELRHFDVPADHPVWYSQQEIAAGKGGSFKIFEKDRYERMSARAGRPVGKEGRRLLFFKGIAEGGTKAKIEVEDAYGFRWKLKWGAEYYSETIASRIYIDLGGKHQDLVYTHGLSNPVTVVFPKYKKTATSDPCRRTENFQDLRNCFARRTLAGIELYNYLGGNTGVFDEQRAQELLEKLPESAREGHSTAELEGRAYAVFNEVSLKLKDEAALRFGPWAQSSAGAENDRALRGLTLFHLWLDNFDAKDDNGQALLTKLPGETEQSLVFAPSDLGASFRGLLTGSGLNDFEVGEKFLHRCLLKRSELVFPKFLLYKPASFTQATYADLYWMAEKIAKFPKAKLAAAVRASGLPDFVQDFLVARLVQRQRIIANYFDLVDLVDSDGGLADLSFHVDSNAEIAQKFGLPLELLAKTRKEYGLSGKVFDDKLIQEGQLATCKESFIVNLLERYAFPSGLTRVWIDKSAQPGICKPRIKLQ